MNAPLAHPFDEKPRHASAEEARLRSFAILLHRYVGLALAVFIVVAGLTGSVLAFYDELDGALVRLAFGRSAEEVALPLDNLALLERLETQLPEGSYVRYAALRPSAGPLQGYFVSHTRDNAPHDDEYFVDRATGEVVGARHWGDPSQGLRNTIPFIYRLHYALGLGEVGAILFGIVSLLWTIDCFVGAYLIFPASRRGKRGTARSGARTWLRRWKASWLIKTSKLFSFVFTWHRAAGLWVWAVLFVFAWSSVGLNLHSVYQPVMTATLGTSPDPYDSLPIADPPEHAPSLTYREAAERGAMLMAEEAVARGFEIHAPASIGYYPRNGVYRYTAFTSLDVSDRYPRTRIWIDGETGNPVAMHRPTGEYAGDTATAIFFAIHLAALARGGFAFKVFVSAIGITVAALAITGVWIWWRKRTKRVATRTSLRASDSHRSSDEPRRTTNA